MNRVLIALLTLCLVGLSACSLFGGPDAGLVLDPDEGAADGFESLVAAAIDRAVVSEKDIPDYGLLANKSRIVVSRITADGDTLTTAALPDTEAVEFVLAWPVTIQEMADEDGDFLYLRIGRVEMGRTDATISISTTWAVGEDSDAVYLSGGGYELRYLNVDDTWVFDEILVTWIS